MIDRLPLTGIGVQSALSTRARTSPSKGKATPMHRITTLLLACSLAACAAGPDYVRPVFKNPQQFKEAEGWKVATPADALDRDGWWALFEDPELDALASRVRISNQNVAAAQAAYEQARAIVREQRSSLFPTVTLSGGATRSEVDEDSSSQSGSTTRYQAQIGASWEPDVWGRLRRATEGASASLSASAADLASATLSAQGELVTNLLSLRETDAEIELIRATVEGYERALTIAENRYKVGVAPLSDVLSAQTQLYGTQAELESLVRQHSQLEHAIAVLVGELPSTFTLAALPWKAVVPEVPLALPSTLLERRPDIAASERRVAVANAQVGIERSAYFPTLALSAAYGSTTSSVSDLFDASSLLWSLGLSITETLFDFGARDARGAQVKAAYDQAVANYRQTVLSAFQDVEDQLSATRVLERQYALRQKTSEVADRNEQLILNQYSAGQVSYSEVVTAQASALSARRSLVQAALDRQTTAVALIQALGGGWSADADEGAPQ
jgi:NodT family efflux transporter outer membrane factor (OMF) lipoprotein